MLEIYLGTEDELRGNYFTLEEKLPFCPGQLVVLNFYNLLDKYVLPKKGNLTGEDYKRKLEESRVSVPGVIKSVRLFAQSACRLPLADVYFLSRWNSGDVSGYLEVKDMPVWRYVNWSEPIPNWFIEEIRSIANRNEKEGCPKTWMDIPVKDLFYIRHIIRDDGKISVYKIYPFRESPSIYPMKWWCGNCSEPEAGYERGTITEEVNTKLWKEADKQEC